MPHGISNPLHPHKTTTAKQPTRSRTVSSTDGLDQHQTKNIKVLNHWPFVKGIHQWLLAHITEAQCCGKCFHVIIFLCRPNCIVGASVLRFPSCLFFLPLYLSMKPCYVCFYHIMLCLLTGENVPNLSLGHQQHSWHQSISGDEFIMMSYKNKQNQIVIWRGQWGNWEYAVCVLARPSADTVITITEIWYNSVMTSSAINPCGAETGIFLGNWVNTIVADALSPCMTRISSALTLTMKDKQALVLDIEGFQLPVLSFQCWKSDRLQTYISQKIAGWQRKWFLLMFSYVPGSML